MLNRSARRGRQSSVTSSTTLEPPLLKENRFLFFFCIEAPRALPHIGPPRSLFLLFVLLFSGPIVEDLMTAATTPIQRQLSNSPCAPCWLRVHVREKT